MDARRFDAVAKHVAARFSRRTALRTGGAGLAAAIAAAAIVAPRALAEGTPVAGGAVAANNATLFVQTATGGTFAPNPRAGTPVAAASPSARGTQITGVGGAYLLTLTGHTGETIAFSDRPQRQFGEVKTTQFFTSMGFTAVNPPNAALVADTPQQAGSVSLVELLNPHYDERSHVLTYEANLLHQYPNARGSALAPLASKAQSAAPAAAFANASLFIDDCPDLTTCYLTKVPGLVSSYVGPIPGEPIGQCWHWFSFPGCQPCSGNSLSYYNGVCNNAYSSQCNGNCFAGY